MLLTQDQTMVRDAVRERDLAYGNKFTKDLQLAAIRDARHYLGDKLIRVAPPHRLLDPAAGPLYAVKLHVLTRKSLGGIQTDLDGRALDAAGEVIPGLFAAGLVAVTFNTIRLQVMAQSAEIEVARMIGATDGFIRRPFYYFGALQGALGGLLAAGLVVAALRLLAGPVGELAALYGGSFALQQPGGLAVAGLAALGAFLGWLGAQLSVSLSLRRFD